MASVVLQSSYRPQIARGYVGMLADDGDKDIRSLICETAAGIGFGLAVSQGTLDRGAILGGSAFRGITVADKTLSLAPLDPLSNTDFTLDKYGNRVTMSVLSRGRIYVLAGATVTPNNDVYYNTGNGGFTNAAGGLSATGYIDFNRQPLDGQTVVINGTTWTFKNSGATGTQSNIGPTIGDTITRLVAALNASGDANTLLSTYAAYPPSPGGLGQGSGAYRVMVSADALGVAGNAYTLAAGTSGVTVSGAVLSGGVAGGTQVVGAKWDSGAIGGDIAIVSLGIQR